MAVHLHPLCTAYKGAVHSLPVLRTTGNIARAHARYALAQIWGAVTAVFGIIQPLYCVVITMVTYYHGYTQLTAGSNAESLTSFRISDIGFPGSFFLHPSMCVIKQEYACHATVYYSIVMKFSSK